MDITKSDVSEKVYALCDILLNTDMCNKICSECIFSSISSLEKYLKEISK